MASALPPAALPPTYVQHAGAAVLSGQTSCDSCIKGSRSGICRTTLHEAGTNGGGSPMVTGSPVRAPLASWRDLLLRVVAGTCAASTIGIAAAVAVDTSSLGIPGTWSMKETRAGNLCEARASFSTDEPGSLEGRVTVRSPCFDAGTGAYKLVLEGGQPTFGWALDYEKSRVFYSATQVEAARPGGTVKARGIIRAAKRSEPDRLAPVGSFTATATLPPAS